MTRKLIIILLLLLSGCSMYENSFSTLYDDKIRSSVSQIVIYPVSVNITFDLDGYADTVVKIKSPIRYTYRNQGSISKSSKETIFDYKDNTILLNEPNPFRPVFIKTMN